MILLWVALFEVPSGMGVLLACELIPAAMPGLQLWQGVLRANGLRKRRGCVATAGRRGMRNRMLRGSSHHRACPHRVCPHGLNTAMTVMSR
jgi:hypothetical protein